MLPQKTPASLQPHGPDASSSVRRWHDGRSLIRMVAKCAISLLGWLGRVAGIAPAVATEIRVRTRGAFGNRGCFHLYPSKLCSTGRDIGDSHCDPGQQPVPFPISDGPSHPDTILSEAAVVGRDRLCYHGTRCLATLQERRPDSAENGQGARALSLGVAEVRLRTAHRCQDGSDWSDRTPHTMRQNQGRHNVRSRRSETLGFVRTPLHDAHG